MKPRTREWLRKAEVDRRIARKGVRQRPPEYDDACFHSQQAVEKYLKALLCERGQTVPHTHDLVRLINLLLPSDPSLRPLRKPAGRLTSYAVRFRYPGAHADKRRAVAAVKIAERARAEVRRLLGLRPRP
jgi:HEPN domain-containing protein